MTDKQQDHPRFFDVLCAAVLTVWIIALLCLCIAFAFGRIASLGDLLVLGFLTLFLGCGTAFILCAIVSLPLWLICKHLFTLNRNIGALIGALTGLIIAAFLIFWLPQDFSGNTKGATRDGWIMLMALTALGMFAGWNGYRVAWSEPIRKSEQKI